MSEGTVATPAAPAAAPAPTKSAPTAPAHTPVNARDFGRTFGKSTGGSATQRAQAAMELPAEEEAVVETPIDDNVAETSSDDTAPAEEAELAPEGEAAEGEPANPYPADIHGVPFSELVEALQNGQLPDALWDVLQMELVDGDDRETVSLREYRDSAMMHRRFTKKSMALAEERRQFAAEKQGLEAERDEIYSMVRSWKDPEQFWKSAKSLGLPIDKVAEKWAIEFTRREQLTPEQRAAEDAFAAREAAFEQQARELRAKERKLKELEQGTAEQEINRKAETFKTATLAHMPSAFAAVGVDLAALGANPDTKPLQTVILNNFREMLKLFWDQGDKNAPPTKEMIANAARATAEGLGIRKAALAPKAAAPAKPAAKPAPAPARPAAKPLAGAASYDPARPGNSPARQQLSARTFGRKIEADRRTPRGR